MHLCSITLLGVWACIQCIATVRATYNYPLSSTRHYITKSFVRPLRAGLRSNEYSSFEEHTGSQSVPSEGSSDVKYDRGRRALSLPVDIIGFLPIPAPMPMPAPATVPVLSISTSPSDNPPDTMTKIRRKRSRGSTADFIARAVEIHGDQYDYSLSEYGKTAQDKVVILCTRHDPPLRFEQSPNTHLSGRGCRACGTARSSQKKRGNTADFIARAVEIHGDQYDYSLFEYGRTAQDKVVILCTRHDPPLRFEQSPNSHLSGYGCRACAIARSRGNTADFIARAVEIHGDQYDYSLSEYGKTAHDKVVILCTRHDPPLAFEQSSLGHLKGSGCPACGTARSNQILRGNTADFIARAVERHGDQYDYSLSEYGNTAHDKVVILCRRHDPPLRFEQSPNTHLSGYGCRECAIARSRGSTADFIARAVEKHGDQYDYSLSEYGKTAKDKVVILCKKHNEFLQSPADHLSGQGCPACALDNNVGWQRRSTLDEFVDRAVEIHGDQYDYSLSEYGKNSGYKVVILCRRHDPPLRFEQSPNNHLSGHGCRECGIARLRSNTSDFIARAVEIHGDQYDYSLSEYGKTGDDKVVILCTSHDPPVAFEQSPHQHLSGQGCPACGSARSSQKRRGNTADFIARAVEIHGDQYDYSLSEYGKTAQDKVVILCRRHDPPLAFEQSPESHLRGYGCRACGIARRSQKLRGNTADFIARAVEIHGD
jgi:hypothetical protein